MSQIEFNKDFDTHTVSEKNVLALFKQHSEKSKTIKQGMSVKEISDLVSDKILELIEKQFKETKKKFQEGENKKDL